MAAQLAYGLLLLRKIADLEQAVSYARAEKASATRRAYHSDFTLFESWCAEKGSLRCPLSLKRWQRSWPL
jgi:hypothetical protein